MYLAILLLMITAINSSDHKNEQHNVILQTATGQLFMACHASGTLKTSVEHKTALLHRIH